MSLHLRFTVAGVPVPKQSFKAGNGHGYQPERVRAWQQAVGWAAREAVGADVIPFAGPVAVSLTFRLPSRRRQDADNLSKAVLDGLRHIVFADDSQVMDLRIVKRLGGEPGVDVEVSEEAA